VIRSLERLNNEDNRWIAPPRVLARLAEEKRRTLLEFR
jgi:hypothetical protein